MEGSRAKERHSKNVTGLPHRQKKGADFECWLTQKAIICSIFVYFNSLSERKLNKMRQYEKLKNTNTVIS